MKNKKTGHTPGPWTATAWGQTMSIDGVGIIGVAHLNPRGNHNAGIPSAEDHANARLIAAAPELLGFAEATAQTFGADTIIGREARATIGKATVIKHKEQK